MCRETDFRFVISRQSRMFAEDSFVSPTSSGTSYGNIRESVRKAMYKKGTPPWRELHKQRLRARLREGRHRLLTRLRGLDATPAGALPGAPDGSSLTPSDQDRLVAEWEQLERDIIAEETDRLIRESGFTDADIDQDWSLLAENLLSDTLTCPLCQSAPAALGPDLRLTCRCGLAVRAPYSDLSRVRDTLERGVANHEAACAESELFFSQSDGELTVVCVGCGMQGRVF